MGWSSDSCLLVAVWMDRSSYMELGGAVLVGRLG